MRPLAGFPLVTAGFYSKDEIIHFAHVHAHGDWAGTLLWLVLLATAFMTAYYTFRLYFRVFEGPTVVPSEPAPDHHHDDSAADAHGHASASAVTAGDTAESGVDAPHGHHADEHGHHDHEPAVMIVPLIVLAIGAIFAGFIQFPFHWLGAFLGDSPSLFYGWDMAVQVYGGNEHTPLPGAFGYETLSFFGYLAEVWLGLVIGGVISLLGIGLAWFLHLKERDRAVTLAHYLRPGAKLLEGKYFVDQIYQLLIVGPLRLLGRVLYGIDRVLIDGLVGAAGFLPWAGGGLLTATTQRSGAVQGYAVSMLLGIALIVLLVAVF